MLSKEVCQKCWNNPNLRYEKFVSPEISHWDFYDEKRWKEGVIFCPLFDGAHFKATNIADVPPVWCPFIFEHAVVEGCVRAKS